MGDTLRIALITHAWDQIVQRPYHWRDQILSRGHVLRVHTMPKPPLHSRKEPWLFDSSREVRRLPWSPWEMAQRRLGREREAHERRERRFEAYVQRNVLDHLGSDWDVVIYSSFPVPNLERHGVSGAFVYDCMDEWSGFLPTALGLHWVPQQVTEYERCLTAQADLILAVSQPLEARLAREHGADRVVLVPNGCDYEPFAAQSAFVSDDRADFVVGYTGWIHDWFDWDAVQAIARAFPRCMVQLVGPVANLPRSLPANVHLEGRQPYEDIPRFNAGFDVCIIPFRETNGSALIAAVSPIKLYEYLASGRPVVSSPMPDTCQLSERGIVHIAESPRAFAEQVADAVRLARNPALIRRRQAIARQNSWTNRWLPIEDRIRQLLRRQHG